MKVVYRQRGILVVAAVFMGCAITNSSSLTPQSSSVRGNKPSSSLHCEGGDKKDATNTATAATPSKKPLWTSPLSYLVLNFGVTEPRFTSRFNYLKKEGVYKCRKCGSELYGSDKKYDSGSGWPSFMEGFEGNVKKQPRDYSGRFEITCGNCDGHLGHVFPDGPSKGQGGTGWRHCVNGAALEFTEGERGED
jgi:peptide-methionine (R)-S-oxide reductase